MEIRHRRPFAKPWKLEEQGESFQIRDAAGRILAYVCFEDEPTRRNFSSACPRTTPGGWPSKSYACPSWSGLQRGYPGQRSQDSPVTSFLGCVKVFAVAWENEHANIIPILNWRDGELR